MKTKYITLVMIFLMIASPALTTQAFENSGDGHNGITRSSLSFLKPSVLDDVDDESTFVDRVHQFDSAYHFDNCSFQESTENINSLYDRAVTALDPNSSDFEDAPDAFGQLLHIVQDFYAHSNWVELNRRDLFNSEYGLWPVLHGRDQYKGMTIIQGEDDDFQDAGISLNRTTGSAIVTVTRPGGAQSLGLMTGTVTYEADDCPDSVALGHWDWQELDGDQGLNKDGPDRRGHNEAFNLARNQTRHEWCRLLSLVEQRYGYRGVAHTLDKFVSNKEEARAACPKDVVLIIDATGSMGDNDPVGRRLEAAKVFIDTVPVGDRISIVAFASSATTLAPLREIQSEADRNALKQAVDGVQDNGSTNINAALSGGYSELLPSGRAINLAILLTDGDHTDGAYDPASHMQYASNGWPVYTIGLGDSTDPTLLSQIAADTGGSYVALSNATQLLELYRKISQRLSGEHAISHQTIRMMQGESRQLNINMPSNRPSATFFTTWPGSEISMDLVSPSGLRIDPQSSDPNIYHVKGDTYEIYTLQTPEAGQWKVNLFGTSLPSGGEDVSIQVSVTGVMDKIFFPITLQQASGGCIPDTRNDSSNIADAITICNGQSVSGQVNRSNDLRDVYRIPVAANQRITISMNGSTAGDADLYLFPPGTTNVITDPYTKRSINLGNSESIQYTATVAGYWYVVVYSYSGTSNYTFIVTL